MKKYRQSRKCWPVKLAVTYDMDIYLKVSLKSSVIHLNIFVAEICTLVIAEAFAEDSGMFTCTASNKYGTMSSSAHLNVRGTSSLLLNFLYYIIDVLL